MADQPVLIRESRFVQITDPVFSIFIPTWNNLSYLILCIESIRKHSRVAVQIIVHVNEGTDGSLEWVRSQNDLSYTYTDNNVGVCFALNQCRTLATADYLMYLNDDMYVCPGWDLAFHQEIKAIGHEAFFISGTSIENVETGNPCVIVKPFGTEPSNFREEELLRDFASFKKSDWQGATWPPNVVHKKVWDLVGGYSIEYSPGLYSDPDFSMKLWKSGIRLFKGLNQCRVYHFGGKSTARMVRNAGYFTFISKWGMTARTFTQKFLRSGQPFNGSLAQPDFSPLEKLKNEFKKMQASLK